jgi:hypothetical protein
VATRDIHPGEVILSERPAAAGPKQFTAPACLGCYAQNVVRYSEENQSHELASCSRCGWPVCSEECELAPAHRAECGYLKVGQTNL